MVQIIASKLGENVEISEITDELFELFDDVDFSNVRGADSSAIKRKLATLVLSSSTLRKYVDEIINDLLLDIS